MQINQGTNGDQFVHKYSDHELGTARACLTVNTLLSDGHIPNIVHAFHGHLMLRNICCKTRTRVSGLSGDYQCDHLADNWSFMLYHFLTQNGTQWITKQQMKGHWNGSINMLLPSVQAIGWTSGISAWENVILIIITGGRQMFLIPNLAETPHPIRLTSSTRTLHNEKLKQSILICSQIDIQIQISRVGQSTTQNHDYGKLTWQKKNSLKSGE